MNHSKSEQMQEYVKMLRKFIYWPMRYTGFCRFDIVNNEIVQLTRSTVIYNVIMLLVANCSVGFLLYSSVVLGNYLKIPDGLCIFHFGLFSNVVMLNLTFPNRHSGLELIEKCMKIDAHLGIKETTFIRNVAKRTFIVLNSIITLTNIYGGIFLYSIYEVPMSIHIVGSLYFFWLFFAYDDYCFGLMLCILNTMRIRYLNVALLQIGEMNEQYLPNNSLFYFLFWNKKFDKLVKFHKTAGIEEFIKAFRMCFEMLYTFEKFYNFPLLYGVWTIFMGSFVAVQTFIMRVKNTSAMDAEHTYLIVGWVILTWGFMVVMTTITDMFSQQIHQTKLICTYIQLKPNKSADIYELTKRVLKTTENRHTVPYVSGMFFFDTGFIFSLLASTLVYITVQLQLAFPRIPLNNAKFNETSV